MNHDCSPNLHQVESNLTIDQLPNEILQSILSYLKLQQLLQLRLVCTRWQNVIESMQHSNQSLILTDSDICEEEIKSRFFGQINLSDFVCLKLKFVGRDAELSECFGEMLRRLFPLIEQLLININFFPNLRFALSLWPVEQISTLSIGGAMLDTNQSEQQDLANRINSLTSLRRLDLVGNVHGFIDSLHLPTLGRIEHFASDTGEEEEYMYEEEHYVTQLIKHLGPNCSRFWVNDSDLDSDCIVQWHSNNPQWLTRVTHLKMNIEDELEKIMRYLGGRATSLQVLHFKSDNIIFLTPQILGHLGQLVHLSELNFFNVLLTNFDDWKKVKTGNQNLVQLTSIQTVTLNLNREMNDYNENVLKRALLVLFPNVKHLSILSENY